MLDYRRGPFGAETCFFLLFLGDGPSMACTNQSSWTPEMHHADLILTLTGGLMAALVLGYATHRIGLSPIVGYLLAGIVVGPHTPGFVANQEMAEQLSEI